MPLAGMFKAILWGIICLWTAFLVFWGGQLFGVAFRTTGLLKLMIGVIGHLVPSKEGRSFALVSIITSAVGAFNGYATFPVLIPGLKEMGYPGRKAAVAWMVYYTWIVAYVSLYVSAHIAAGVAGIEITTLIHLMGIMSLPICFISSTGFFVIMGFDAKKRDNLCIAAMVTACNVLSVLLFMVLLPKFHLFTLFFASVSNLIALRLYGRRMDSRLVELGDGLEGGRGDAANPGWVRGALRAFAPLVICMALMLLVSGPLAAPAALCAWQVSLWGYGTVSVNLVTAPGTFILITALLCYAFAPAGAERHIAKDFVTGTKKALPSIGALMCGAAMVQLLLDTAQLQNFLQAIADMGNGGYICSLSGLAFACGLAFNQSIPAIRMFLSIALPMSFGAGALPVIAALVCLSTTNPMKPALLKLGASLADIPGQDGRLFADCLPWQLAILGASCIMAMLLL